jgi:hypothetical protein
VWPHKTPESVKHARSSPCRAKAAEGASPSTTFQHCFALLLFLVPLLLPLFPQEMSLPRRPDGKHKGFGFVEVREGRGGSGMSAGSAPWMSASSAPDRLRVAPNEHTVAHTSTYYTHFPPCQSACLCCPARNATDASTHACCFHVLLRMHSWTRQQLIQPSRSWIRQRWQADPSMSRWQVRDPQKENRFKF